jgi:hypothetical protein
MHFAHFKLLDVLLDPKTEELADHQLPEVLVGFPDFLFLGLRLHVRRTDRRVRRVLILSCTLLTTF